MRLLRIGALTLVVLTAACGGSNSTPTSTPAPARPGSGSAQQPSASCPAPPLEKALGAPCATPGQSCGAEACGKATGFCNIIVCRGGVWANVEVPPPPPPPP